MQTFSADAGFHHVASRDGWARARIAHLLNTQALHLDSVDVLSLVPSHWPLATLGSFLERSLRRQLHIRQEGQIVKAISLGQSLKAADRAWQTMRYVGFGF